MVILHPTVGSSGSPYIQHSCCSAFRQECIWNFTPSRNLILGIHRINQPHGVHCMADAKVGRISVRGSVDRFSPPHHARAPRFHCDLDGGTVVPSPYDAGPLGEVGGLNREFGHPPRRCPHRLLFCPLQLLCSFRPQSPSAVWAFHRRQIPERHRLPPPIQHVTR